MSTATLGGNPVNTAPEFAIQHQPASDSGAECQEQQRGESPSGAVLLLANGGGLAATSGNTLTVDGLVRPADQRRFRGHCRGSVG